jgi:hypothetical protein
MRQNRHDVTLVENTKNIYLIIIAVSKTELIDMVHNQIQKYIKSAHNVTE